MDTLMQRELRAPKNSTGPSRPQANVGSRRHSGIRTRISADIMYIHLVTRFNVA